ncbi:STAS domain-containing protein [Streptomyces sp. AP-93]|uniref:STAS domain-containing protein n=1 Tax=Streptomyces sp. AP-93 TaxID=2929048 RepID=UPI001FAF31D4|nr:STAS domain-containing protein [Streptomyces sp. AP-93]MCJ0872642.1 STAS domain-containing protein [Streptomyces sp. AP-93]
MITVDIENSGSTVMVSVSGELDEDSGRVLLEALSGVTINVRGLLVDLHRVAVMDTDGLLCLLGVHRRAESLGLRVLVTGWQPQPQQCMADVAGIPGPGSPTGERYALAGFRRLIEERAQRARDSADLATGWLPRT